MTAVEPSSIEIYYAPVANVIVLAVLLIGAILTMWALVSVLKSTFKDPNGKVIWVLIVLFLNLFGALLWFFWGRRTSRKTYPMR